jgi:hypothetical protein
VLRRGRVEVVSVLAGRPREQVGLGAAVPLDQHRRGVVLELPRLAVDDGVSEPTQRFGSGLPGRGLPLDEPPRPVMVNIRPSR